MIDVSYDSCYGSLKNEDYRAYLTTMQRHPALLIEITSKCNFFCDYCISPNSPRTKGLMSMEMFTHIVDQAAGLAKDGIRLHLDGEPTIHPQFHAMAKMVNERGLRVWLASNGSTMKPEYLDLDMDIRVYLSLTPAELKRRANINFDTYWRRLAAYLKAWYNSESKQQIFFTIYFNPGEASDDPLVIADKNGKLKEFLQQAEVFDESWNDRDLMSEFSISNRAGYRFFSEKILIVVDAVHGNQVKLNPPVTRGFCDAAWNTMAILNDGRVSHCCSDLTGGTAYTEPDDIWRVPLRELWENHPRIKAAREELLSLRVTNSTCQKCLSSYGSELYMSWNGYPPRDASGEPTSPATPNLR